MWSQSWGHSFIGSIWIWFLFCQNFVLTGEASNWDEAVSFSNPESPSLEAFSLNSAWKLCSSLFSSPLLMLFYGWCLKTHLWLSAFFLKASLGRPTASLGIPHIPDGASLGIPISEMEPHHWASPYPRRSLVTGHSPCPRRSLVAGRPHVPDGASSLGVPMSQMEPHCLSRQQMMAPLPQPAGAGSWVLFQASLMFLLLFLQQCPQPIPQTAVSMLWVSVDSTLFLIPDIVFSYLFCLIRPELSGLKQNYYLLKTLQAELDFLLIWLGIIHATTDTRRLNWGWPPKKSGVTGIDGGQLYIVSLQADSPAEKLDLFTWCLRAPRDWEQKHPGLLESMQRAGTAALLRVPSVKASPRAREISFTCW